MWNEKPVFDIETTATEGANREIGVPGWRLSPVALFVLILVFFFLSGACGLLYQVVWTRKLVLLFGTASYAVSTVLSIFFAGLGVGSLWGGRLADKTERPLFWYGLLELGIGFWAILFILFVDQSESFVVMALRAFAFSRNASIAIRAVLAFAFLIVPVTLMGATLPLLVKFLASNERTRGFRIGALYSINTFGAVGGCVYAGFLALPVHGFTWTTLIGAVGNIGVGITALILFRLPLKEPIGRLAFPEAVGESRASFHNTLILLAFCISGLCALALEVLWTRLLTLVFLGTTYAFTTMLATLLCGIAVGSAVAAALVDRFRRPSRERQSPDWHPRPMLLFGLVEMLIGVSCILMLPLFADLPERLDEMTVNAGYSWDGIAAAKFFLSFFVLFAPAFLFGTTFPIAAKGFTASSARLGRDIGRLYSANTFGGVLGALIGGYILIPFLGVQHGIEVLSWILLGVGVVLVILCQSGDWRSRGLIVVGSVAFMILASRMASDDVSLALNKGYIPKNHQVLAYREGVEGTVAVSDTAEGPPGSDRVLWINGVQATTSIEKGVKMNRFQGVLPLVFDRKPREALFMCFGSGITAGTLGLYDFDRIDAVEISRDVLDMAPLFASDNLDVMANLRIRFTVDDGRNFLLTTENRYDVITFEPMPLALAGVSTFYTREFYLLCRERLTPGGLVSQWVPLHSLDPDTVRSLVATFDSVFPECCAWFVNADLFLVGSNAPLRIDYSIVTERLVDPVLRKALGDVGLDDVTELLSCFLMSKDHVAAFARGGMLMTDDWPWAEFVAPKVMFKRTVDISLGELEPYFESPVSILKLRETDSPESREIVERLERRYRAKREVLQGLKLYYGGTFGAEPEKFFKGALDIDSEDRTAQYYLREITSARVQTYLHWEKTGDAIACLEGALQYLPQDREFHRMLADLCFDREDFAKARRAYDAYIALGGDEPRALERFKRLQDSSPAENP